jgi:hypothetical protein
VRRSPSASGTATWATCPSTRRAGCGSPASYPAPVMRG